MSTDLDPTDLLVTLPIDDEVDPGDHERGLPSVERNPSRPPTTSATIQMTAPRTTVAQYVHQARTTGAYAPPDPYEETDRRMPMTPMTMGASPEARGRACVAEGW